MSGQDTEWNDILIQKGIRPAPAEKEVTEDEIISMIDKAAENKLHKEANRYENKTLAELDELSGDEDEKIILEYRKKRVLEMKEQMMKAKFGDVREITAENYVAEVNKAGEGVWVVLLLYQNSIPLCKVLQEYWTRLAQKFPAAKFIKSIASLCIANFPEKNLPTVFVYFENDMKRQFVGAGEFSKTDSTPISIEELEWKLHEVGAVKSTLPENPKNKRPNITGRSILLQDKKKTDDSDEDDDW